MSGMSRRNFLRAFESTMGCPPITYLIRLRIRRASELLQQHESSITEIAMAVGFNDSNYFSRQFRAVTGESPRNYRRRRELIEYRADA
jgi:transcriptional regulator GlxA family with amidase domain